MAQQSTETKSKKAAPKLDQRDGGVRDFLDRFARAITSGDARQITSLWGVPSLVMGDNGVQAVNSLEEVKQFFAGAKEQYNARGITDTRPDIFGLEWATDRIAIVSVRWPYLDASGKERGEEASTYTLRRDDAGDLKVQAVIMRGESTSE
jgi:hypothetical protein